MIARLIHTDLESLVVKCFEQPREVSAVGIEALDIQDLNNTSVDKNESLEEVAGESNLSCKIRV
jgi:hypothetical protein